MKRSFRPAAALAALGVTVGVMLAVVGLPYGRINPNAFAELYHGPTGTEGTFHMAIDCSPHTTQTDESCVVFPGMLEAEIAVTLGNSTGQTVQLGAFMFIVRANQTLVHPQVVADPELYLNGNPDMSSAILGTWVCGPPEPAADITSDPSVADSLLGCFNPAVDGPLFPSGIQHLKLGTITYDYIGGEPQSGTDIVVDFSLMSVEVYDESFGELGTCRPIVNVLAHCFDSEIIVLGHHFPTPTPEPDSDGDSIPNMTDNCPLHANSAQTNTDRNLISNAPVFVQNDTTRAHSDNLGDACDDDDDNDGVTDLVEMLHCPYGMWPTNPLAFDTDGDRFHDGAECALYTDATRSDSKPAITSCGLATDGDGDGLVARLEYCFYGTGDSMLDTDGDGVKDGCEAASFNPDTIVNVADRGMLASEIIRGVPPSAKLVNLDVNKDGAFNVGDIGLVAQRFGKCP